VPKVEVLDGRHESVNSQILVFFQTFQYVNIPCLENRVLDLSKILYNFKLNGFLSK
jgi:hypothetical protein